ncbi:TonB-dependent siderophore receptor [Gemmobacter lanyuensis]
MVNASDSATTGNAALLYRFDSGVAPYVSYAESFKQEFVGTDVDGNPFEPSRGTQYEVGTRWQSADGASLVSLALFDITRSNITVSDPANPGFMIQTGKATSRGVELELRHAWGDLAVEANASWLRTEDVNGARLSGVPERMGSVWATWKPSEGTLAGFKAGLGVRARGAVWDGSDVQRTPGFGLVDAMIGYETEAYDLALNVRNLGNLSYVTYCGAGRATSAMNAAWR